MTVTTENHTNNQQQEKYVAGTDHEEGDILIDGIYEHNNSETAEVVRINHQQNETEPMVYLSCAVDDQAVQYTRVEGPVRFDTFRVSKNVSIDQENGVLESYAGYRSVRATHGAFEGTWMFEVKVEDVEPGVVGVRVGWSTKSSTLDEPVGSHVDGYGYSLYSQEAIHDRKKIQYGNEVKAGDVIGCLLHLSNRGRAFEPAPSDFVRYKGRIHTRMRIDGGCLPTRTNIEGSFMEVYINGMSQGRVFCDAILEGTYYPTVSLFTRSTDPSKKVKARVNFGSSNRGGENGQGWWADYVEHCFQTCVKSVAMLACDDADEDSI